ncbi:extracellular solute-binding protein [Microbacterium sp. QXD-8]|uniref:Extracellular solute-binding protein n=1 Tax=Microbacterium psychrotolerans TaxID=3068321 RepID=A0ABU0YW26_9MICO|nr:extracellular solute-binding protein [Microbacterium sp. QXD-8]MDQ7876534.1 extracellular solute-binding protein [Microbacterium sp. QXD-8]
MKTRSITAALLTTALAATTLTACSSSSEDGVETVTVWDNGLLTRTNDDGTMNDSNSFLTLLAAQYEQEHPDVKIKIVRQSADITKNSAQFQAASIAKNGPDIRVGYIGGNTEDYSDFLLDLDGTFSDETVADISGWNLTRKGYSPDGALLGLPYGAGSYFYVFYNRQMTDAAGLDLTTPPATWEDLLAAGEQVQENTSNTAFWVANQEGYVGAWVVAALAGGELGPDAFIDMYTGETSTDSDGLIDAYTAYARLFEDGLTNPDAASVSNADALSGFIQGKGAFYISGSWDNTYLTDAFGDGVGVFAIPMLEGAAYPDTVAGGPNVDLSITSYSKHQEAAKDFLRFLAQPSSIEEYTKLYQSEAPNSASASTAVITNPLLQQEAAGLTTSQSHVYPIDNVMPQSVNDLYYKINATVFTGRTSPKDAVEQLAAAVADATE